MKNNLIFVLYYNESSISRQDFQQVCCHFTEEFEEIGKLIIIPVTDQETKLECIYPNINENKQKINDIMIKLYELMTTNKNEEFVHMIKDIDRKLKISKILD
jgi:hypothetical protein